MSNNHVDPPKNMKFRHEITMGGGGRHYIVNIVTIWAITFFCVRVERKHISKWLMSLHMSSFSLYKSKVQHRPKKIADYFGRHENYAIRSSGCVLRGWEA